MTINQTHLVHEVLTNVYGDSWLQEILSSMVTMAIVPMIAGIQHEESLATTCFPNDSEGLKHAMAKHGFSYRTLHVQLQYQWTLVLTFKLLCKDWRNIKMLLRGNCISCWIVYILWNINCPILIFHCYLTEICLLFPYLHYHQWPKQSMFDS